MLHKEVGIKRARFHYCNLKDVIQIMLNYSPQIHHIDIYVYRCDMGGCYFESCGTLNTQDYLTGTTEKTIDCACDIYADTIKTKTA